MSDTALYSNVKLKNLRPKEAVNQFEDVTYSQVKFSNSLHPKTDSQFEPGDNALYSTVGQTTENRPGAQHTDNAQHRTVGQTTDGLPGAQHTVKTGTSSNPHRLAAVCLGLLCTLLLVIITALSITNYNRSNENSSVSEKLHQLKRNYNILSEDKDQLQRNYSILSEDKDQLQINYNILSEDKDQLQRNYNILSEDKDQLQRIHNALLKKSPILQLYCHSTIKGVNCSPCPQGWVVFRSSCYYFSTAKKSWTESQSECVKQGAGLVIIESEEEQEFINTHTTEEYWIGLKNLNKERTWIWVDGSPLTTRFWSPGRPYYSGSCAVSGCYRASKCDLNAWHEVYCNAVRRWVCETEALLV